MKPLSEMTHYEVLEVEPEASASDVERAYRIASATYSDDSLATYSLYEESEVEAIRERIEQAYQVLASNEARVDYDVGIGGTEPASEPGLVEIELDFETVSDVALANAATEIDEFTDLEDLNDGSFDGARLRRTRLSRGIDIGKIAQITKINPTYLECIEEERFDELPADVYVRGFVVAYAGCVGLDPDRVAPVYMDRLRSSRRPAGPPGRARGRRR